jgi:hypothetical protein
MRTRYITERWTVSPQGQATGVDWYQFTSLCIRVMSNFSERVNESRTSSLKLCWTHDQRLVVFWGGHHWLKRWMHWTVISIWILNYVHEYMFIETYRKRNETITKKNNGRIEISGRHSGDSDWVCLLICSKNCSVALHIEQSDMLWMYDHSTESPERAMKSDSEKVTGSEVRTRN